MISVEQGMPADVVDRMLWRNAQHILDRHTASDARGRCTWCGDEWPCLPRQLAERADAASRQPWPDQPGPDQPGPDQPGSDQPGSDQPGPDQ